MSAAAVALWPAPDAPPPVPSARPVDLCVHLIHGGRIRSGTVRSRLPECVTSTQFGPGPLMPQASAVLTAVASTVARCAPWLRVYVGPRLWSECDASDTDAYACRPVVRPLPDGRIAYEHHGVACLSDGVLLVASAARLPVVMGTLHHEVWHAVERQHLHVDDIACITAAVARGQPRPGDYLASAIERRARLYEAWASAWDEGWRPASVLGRPLHRLDRVLAYVHGGGLARDVSAGRPARCQRARWHAVALWVQWLLLQPESAPYPL